MGHGVPAQMMAAKRRPADAWSLLSVSLLLSAAPPSAVGAFEVAVSIGGASAQTRVSALTSVTMDVCVAKQGFPFGDKDLLALTKHLGGGDAVLRIGGSDQNSFYYNMSSSKAQPYSPKSGGGPCTEHPGSCHGVAPDCTMPAPYWQSMVSFAASAGHKFMFGLVPDVEQATQLISHSAALQLPVFAFTFGNELAAARVTAGYPILRKLLDSLFAGKTAPMLAGPDLYAQHSFQYTLEQALAGEDKDVVAHLAGMRDFAEKAGSTLDAFSWHTYDYETPMLGMVDHQDLKMNPLVSRLWSTKSLSLSL